MRLVGRKTVTGFRQGASLVELAATLESAEVPIDHILLRLEGEGMPLDEIVRWAAGYLRRARNGSASRPPNEKPEPVAELLVFGSIHRWEWLLPEMNHLGWELYHQLLIDTPGYHPFLSELMPPTSFERFRRRTLRRLGFPGPLIQSLRSRTPSPKATAEVLKWLEAERPLLANDLKLRRFRSRSTRWGKLHVPSLVLQDGEGPTELSWSSNSIDLTPRQMRMGLRIERVHCLKVIQADMYGESVQDPLGRAGGKLCVRSCPDLERLDGLFEYLELVNCPSLRAATLGVGTRWVSILNCSGLRVIRGWGDQGNGESCPDREWVYEVDDLHIEGCPSLRRLPSRLRINRRFALSACGRIEAWPLELSIGGEFLIMDCPAINMLPPMDVYGSLVIKGDSGIQRLSSGTTIGRDLDLRACSLLQELPADLKVGGTLFLPDHLKTKEESRLLHKGETTQSQQVRIPGLEEDLRALLKGLQFTQLIHSADRPQSREEALVILKQFRQRLQEDPQQESAMVWAASEVWRDLAEEAWAAANPWAATGNDSDEELPSAWFRHLLYDA
jgi:hypothetical protein